MLYYQKYLHATCRLPLTIIVKIQLRSSLMSSTANKWSNSSNFALALSATTITYTLKLTVVYQNMLFPRCIEIDYRQVNLPSQVASWSNKSQRSKELNQHVLYSDMQHSKEAFSYIHISATLMAINYLYYIRDSALKQIRLIELCLNMPAYKVSNFHIK